MENLPKYTVYRSSRRSIRLVLRPNGSLSVYCPKRCPIKDIEEMIKRHFKEMQEKFNSKADALFKTVNGQITLPLLGTRYPVVFEKVKKLSFDGASFISPTESIEELRSFYREFLREQAKMIMPAVANEISEGFGLSYNGLTVKAIYSRYGSCSAKKHLNFSLALAAFDMEFIRFVISHELCHTAHMNHGQGFYSLLGKVYPEHRSVQANGARERSAILKAIFFSPA
ncbi:MAG: M48 family metallopeptidase [Clostridia bacterium]|nr:M48 family metallopeptidase [Clostridia bacterium]